MSSLHWSEEKRNREFGFPESFIDTQDAGRDEPEKNIGAAVVDNATPESPQNVADSSNINKEATVSLNESPQSANKVSENEELSTTNISVVNNNTKLIGALDLAAKANALGFDLDKLRQAFSIVDVAYALGVDIERLYAAAQKRVREDSPSPGSHPHSKRQRQSGNPDEEVDDSADVQGIDDSADVQGTSSENPEEAIQNPRVPRERGVPDGDVELLSANSQIPQRSTGVGPRKPKHGGPLRAISIDSGNISHSSSPADIAGSHDSNHKAQVYFQKPTNAHRHNRSARKRNEKYEDDDHPIRQNSSTVYTENMFSEALPPVDRNGKEISYAEAFNQANGLKPSNPEEEFSGTLPQTNNNNSSFSPLHPFFDLSDEGNKQSNITNGGLNLKHKPVSFTVKNTRGKSSSQNPAQSEQVRKEPEHVKQPIQQAVPTFIPRQVRD